MSDVIEQRPRRRSGMLRLLTMPLSLVLIAATAVGGGWLIKHTPGSQEMNRPFVHSGRAGEALTVEAYTVSVLGVRGATQVLDHRDETFTTDGVFVLVEVRIEVSSEPLDLTMINVVDPRGRTFDLVDRLSQRITETYRFEPGVAVEGDLAFEIPADAVPGLALQLSDQDLIEVNFFQVVARIDLDVDQSAADRWLAERRTLEMKLPVFS